MHHLLISAPEILKTGQNAGVVKRQFSAQFRALQTPELLACILNNCTRLELEVACAVCHAWNEVVGAFTHLSTSVVYNPHLRADIGAFQRALARGRQRRVFIRIPSMKAVRRAPISRVIGRHASRIKGLAVGQLCFEDLKHIWSLIRQGMPVMEELILQGATERDEPGPNALFTLPALLNSAPQLRRLACSGVNIYSAYKEAKLIDIIEYASLRVDGVGAALSLWDAPWPEGALVTGLSVRENARGATLESWIATAWAGTINSPSMTEDQLTGDCTHTFLNPRERLIYRRLVLDESLRGTAFSSNLTIISMPLYFWGLARHELGHTSLPNLSALHLLLVELDDDAIGEGSLVCPQLRNVGLQVHTLQGYPDYDEKWEYFISCSYQEIEEFIRRALEGVGAAVIDLLASGFRLSGQPTKDGLEFRGLRDVSTFQSWLSVIPRL